jgi:hypothetical protein
MTPMGPFTHGEIPYINLFSCCHSGETGREELIIVLPASGDLAGPNFSFFQQIWRTWSPPKPTFVATLEGNVLKFCQVGDILPLILCTGPVPPQRYTWKRPAAAAKPPASAPASTDPACRPPPSNPPPRPPTPAHRDPLSASTSAVIRHPLGQGPQAEASSALHSAVSLPLPPGVPLAEAGEVWDRASLAAHKGPQADKSAPEMAACSAVVPQLPMPPMSSGYGMVFHPYRTGNMDRAISSLACPTAPGDTPSPFRGATYLKRGTRAKTYN